MSLRLPVALAESGNWPLGTHVAGNAVTFAVAAPLATRVVLEVHGPQLGRPPLLSTPLTRDDAGVWRVKVDNLGPGAHYGFRCWGPNFIFDQAWVPGSAAGFRCDVDDAGNRFNPNKLLVDPYAREWSHVPLDVPRLAPGQDAGMFGTGGDEYRGAPRRQFDTGPWAPRGIVIDDATDVGTKPALPAENSAIYEAHVLNLSAHPTAVSIGVPDELRGTYAGAAHLAPYLKALGFTTIELLPVHQSTGLDALSAGPDNNHWGYQTLGFFAPNRSYARDQSPGGPTREFKSMVRAFHEAGLEVYLDVVYNHSGEGGQWGGDRDTTGFVTLGGFGTPEYYLLSKDQTLVDGATGTSNQLDYDSGLAQRLVLDSLTYWSDVMGVDGFRFDLAPVLGRDSAGFERDHPLLLAIASLAESRSLEVIAEAWDLWGYEVGNFPAGWAEWNGRYRDAVRAFLKGQGNALEFAAMVNGDFQHFCDQGGPQRSINFVDAHDGFTMTDLVSYNTKLNEQPYPFGPSDGGTDDNRSWDSGGDHGLRRQRLRNFWLTLFLSRGVPMVVAGDEYGRTQNGNNNPWALNSPAMWNNYAALTTAAPTQVPIGGGETASYHDNLGVAEGSADRNPLYRFATELARFRQEQRSLRQRSYGDADTGDTDDVSYEFRSVSGGMVQGSDRALRLLIDASAVGGRDLLVLFNLDATDHTFPIAGAWNVLADTARRSEAEDNWCPAGLLVTASFLVPAWSITLLQAA